MYGYIVTQKRVQNGVNRIVCFLDNFKTVGMPRKSFNIVTPKSCIYSFDCIAAPEIKYIFRIR